MDKYAAPLELLTPDEVADALHFVDVMQRAGRMDADEAETWRVKIEAWCRFRLAVETAGSNRGMASRPYVHVNPAGTTVSDLCTAHLVGFRVHLFVVAGYTVICTLFPPG